MIPFAKMTALCVFVIVVSACQDKTGLPIGTNYVLEAQPKIIINLKEENWALYEELPATAPDMKSAFVLSATKISVLPTNLLQLPADITIIGGQRLGFEKDFRLARNMLGVIYCERCPTGKDQWNKVLVP